MPTNEEIEDELERLLASPALLRSPQLAKFLRHIVERKLAGEAAGIKAYSIAVDVFGRPADFDPQVDPIVRVQARRLRTAIENYYANEGAGSRVKIFLPVGGYVPEFEVLEGDEAERRARRVLERETHGRPAGAAWMSEVVVIAGLVIVTLALAILGTDLLQPKTVRMDVPEQPKLLISDFLRVPGNGDLSVADGLAIELVTDLQLFETMDVGFVDKERAEAEDPEETYRLSGIVRWQNGRIEATANLKLGSSDAALWSQTETVPATQGDGLVDTMSRRFAERLGSHQSPLHQRALVWLRDHPDITGNETSYLCFLLFEKAHDSGERADKDRAGKCASGLIKRDPASAVALAISGAILAEDLYNSSPPGASASPDWDTAVDLLTRSRRLNPTNSFIWEQYAKVLETRGEYDEAATALASSLQLNPANLDAVAASARLTLLRISSPGAEQMARNAISASYMAPPWYFAGLAVNALRDQNNVLAMTEAEELSKGDAELGTVVATVAASRLNSQTMLNRYLAQLLEVSRFRQFGIMPVVRQRIQDSQLVKSIETQLAMAGVSVQQLEGSF